jgi:hypothetical protein
MRPLCLFFCLLLNFTVPVAAAASAAGSPVSPTSPGSPGSGISPACNVASSDPAASGEPPAWLLLASAVVLLAAGRLAGSGSR